MIRVPSLALAAFATAMIVLPSAACAVPLVERLLSSTAASSSRSPGVSVADVAKEVAPQTFQIDPRAVQGRRLIIDAGDAGKLLCIGAWRKGVCFGIYVEPSQAVAAPVPPPAPPPQ
jgi:hypothetical protein